MTDRVRNAMTVDVEEHFQVSAFERENPRSGWAEVPSRVRANTARVLDLFDEHGVRGTFFVLGWVAEHRSDVVRDIAVRGHEIACHGYSHRLIYRQTPDEFRVETERSRKLLQDLSGQPVDGYRAASFSIRADSLWALDILTDLGFRYDSSVFPVVHDRYGIPGAPRRIHRLRSPGGGDLIEVPPSTVRLRGVTLPIAGGGYLRIFPRAVTYKAIDRLNRVERMPAVVYIHPWEVDPEQPRMSGSVVSRLRHYTGLGTTVGKLHGLMRRFAFGPMGEIVRHEAGLAELPTIDLDAPGRVAS